MANFDSWPDDYKPYPVREFLVSDKFGNHIFYFRFYPGKIDVCSIETMDDPTPCVYPDYKTNLNVDLTQYPHIWELILQLLELNLDTSFFNATAQKLFKKIKSIPGIEAFYFPKQVLRDGYINWIKYNAYERFQNQEDGYDLTKMLNQAITETSFPIHHWFLRGMFASKLYIQTEISKSEFENLIGRHEALALDYINLYKFSHSRFFITKDREGEQTYKLCTLTVKDEPILFFVVSAPQGKSRPEK